MKDAEDLVRDPATGIYEPQRALARSGSLATAASDFWDAIDPFRGETWKAIGEVLTLPLEAVLALIRNGARLIMIGGVLYLVGPSIVSGVVSGKIARGGRKRKRKKR